MLGRPILGTRAAVAALTVAVLVVAALAVSVTVAARDDEGAVDRDGLRAESGRIVAAVFSVEAGSKKGSVASLVTEDFAATYGSLLRGTPASGVRSIRWRPTASAVIDAGTGWGETLTAFDVVTTPESGQAETGTRTLWIRLVRSGDTWKLARVEQTV